MLPAEKSKKALFQKLLLDWWTGRNYEFPWRCNRDSYLILVAELMLRKTTVKQVMRVYPKFIMQYPTLRALQNADDAQLISLLKPLGIEHERTRLLKKLSSVIAEKHGWEVPSNINELMQLPGVGKYTANAVLCFAFGKDLPALDSNFIRVLKRVFNKESKKSRAHYDPVLWSFAKELIPEGKGREFNFAILDFAREICSARKPKCKICPLSKICYNFNNGCSSKRDTYC